MSASSDVPRDVFRTAVAGDSHRVRRRESSVLPLSRGSTGETLFFDTNLEGARIVGKPQKLFRTVRVLEKSARIAVRATESSTSSIKTGKLADSLQSDIQLLWQLAEKNAHEQFRKVLQRAVNKLVKLCRKLVC